MIRTVGGGGAERKRLVSPRDRLSSMTPRDRVGWSLLVAAAALGWPAIGLPSFVDEFDTLSVGRLMATGSVLYRDVFSHHFPLPYNWVAVVVTLVGPSFGAVRASIWLFTFGAMAIVMLLTRRRLATGVFALCWALVRVMYNGHMAMYTTWSAIAVWVVFVLALEAQADSYAEAQVDLQTAAPRRGLAPGRLDGAIGIVFGIASAVAVLSDPLTIYAVALSAVALARRSRRRITTAMAVGSVVVAAVFGMIAAQGGLGAFWDDVVRFNVHYSERYVVLSPLRLTEMVHTALRGLYVAERYWRNFDPWKPLSWTYGEFDIWAFSGLAYRLVFLAASASWLFKRRPFVALWLYAFAVTTLANDRFGFRAGTLAIVGIWLLAAFATGEWPAEVAGRLGRTAFGVAGAVVLAWLMVRVAAFAYAPAQWHERAVQYGSDIVESDRLKALACGQPNVELAAWPDQTSTYWYTKWRPVAGYIYFWPWVAEAALPEALDRLADPDVRAVVVLNDTKVWGRWDTRDYLAPLHRMLEADYVSAGPGTWLSPALASACRAARNAPTTSAAANATSDPTETAIPAYTP